MQKKVTLNKFDKFIGIPLALILSAGLAIVSGIRINGSLGR